MKTSVVILVLLFVAPFAFPQADCDCEQAMKQLIRKVEAEYPGFKDKTKDRLVYDNFKETLVAKARQARNPDCIELLRRYKDFFRDGHMSIYPSGNQADLNGKEGKIRINRDDFQKRILDTTDPLEGIWKSDAYKVGIVRMDGEYAGFIMEADPAYWRPDEIKFRLFENGKAFYYLRDHSLSEETYELVDGWILFFNFSKYVKLQPKPNLTDEEIKSRMVDLEGCYFKKLTEKTSLLCLSSFEHNFTERINKLLADHKDDLENGGNLIIDVRNNLGGVYESYEKLLPYVLTGDVRGMGMEFLATETLINEVQNWYEDEEGRKKASGWIKMFKEKMGQFVNTDPDDAYVTEVKPEKKSPAQIVILANRRTASSGEAFVLDAKQSKKVKILGTPTYGALDYGSASFFDFGCGNYKLMMPTWRSMRLPDYPIDNIGIQPDIYLDKSVKDWVRFAVDYLEGNT
ncbi:MAG TPA: S41 family peptidase [Candidatus Aminicenantes bacterium]|nr:S41 family peptidase [Candidatus Aminicenantes bacterium]